jgi:F420-0:gamma-glutamyl ligase
LVWAAGIDDSNSGGYQTLWPADPQASANQAREFLRSKFGRKKIGVILTDSSIRPYQWGTTGVAIAYSGFEPLHDYVGQKDLFGHAFRYQKNNIKDGLAAAAALVAGEGDEQTPLVILEKLEFVSFVEHDPTEEELDSLRIQPGEDAYAPLFENAPWRKGQGRA